MATATFEYTITTRDRLGSDLTEYRLQSLDPGDTSWFVDITTIGKNQPFARFRTFLEWLNEKDAGVCVQIDNMPDFVALTGALEAGPRMQWHRTTSETSSVHVFTDRGGREELFI